MGGGPPVELAPVAGDSLGQPQRRREDGAQEALEPSAARGERQRPDVQRAVTEDIEGDQGVVDDLAVEEHGSPETPREGGERGEDAGGPRRHVAAVDGSYEDVARAGT